jgi:hypothetical protein
MERIPFKALGKVKGKQRTLAKIPRGDTGNNPFI